MAVISMVFGFLMTVLGATLYGAAWYRHVAEPAQYPGNPSPTALFPAAFGIALIILGMVARRSSSERTRMHVMHAAATVGLLGIITPLVRLGMRINEFAWSMATTGLVVLAGLNVVFMILCVKSFIDVRRARKAREQAPPA
jgi:hypothetical protein